MSFLDNLKSNKTKFEEKQSQIKQLEEKEKEELKDKSQPLSLFEMIDCMTFSKVKWEDLGENNQKKLQMFMINKVFSMIYPLHQLLTDVQMNQKTLSVEHFYKLIYYGIPAQKFNYKYIKPTLKENTYKDELVEIFCNYFEEKKENVVKYLHFIPYEQKKVVLRKYGKSEEEILNLFKA